MLEEANRRVVGFVLFGSAAFMLLGAVLVASGTFAVAEGSRTLITIILGVVVILDALVGLYFIASSRS